MIYASAEPGFIICDPFMGSGSSAIAAIKNQCNFLGCDVAAKAVEVTDERVERYIQEGQDPFQKKSAALPEDKVFWEEDSFFTSTSF